MKPWSYSDSGPLSAEHNMHIDRVALEQFHSPLIRFFEWTEPVITYGYLMDETRVSEWARENGNLNFVKRPTGGGAVIHRPEDLSVSVLWGRGSGILPDKPRDAYQAIHTIIKTALEKINSASPLSLQLGEGRVRGCFSEAGDPHPASGHLPPQNGEGNQKADDFRFVTPNPSATT